MYYIYHIKGVKIGCTKNPSSRIRQQNALEYEILETHSDINIASDREIQLQIEYGYKVDTTTYVNSIKNNPMKQHIAGKASATKSWKENRDRELQKSSKGGKINAEKNGKPVIMCDMNGVPLKFFKNRSEAAMYVDGNKPPLIQVINKSNNSYRGYKWITPDNQDDLLREYN